jgi:hypothetical protein
MYLDWALVGMATSMSRVPAFTKKNPPSTSIDEKYVNYSTSASHSIFSSLYVTIISICSSSSKSLIITIVV